MARCLGATDISSMAGIAIACEQWDVCRLAAKWGHRDWGDLVESYFQIRKKELILLAFELGYDNYNHVLLEATIKSDVEMCQLAKKLGADDFKSMLRFAEEHGREKLRHLALLWDQKQ